MNNDNPFSHEMWQRVERLVNDECSDDDIRILEDALRGDPAAQDLFLEYCQLHLDLSVEIFADVASDHALERIAGVRRQASSPTSSEPKNIGRPVSAVSARAVREAGGFRSAFSHLGALPFCPSLSAVLLVSACLLTAMGGIVGWRLRGDGQAPSTDLVSARPQISPVAYLVSANGCEWGSRTPLSPIVGSSLGAGDEITLDEGIAEFRLENGVLLSIEGPASVVLSSPTSMLLEYGKVTAHVRWTPADFQVGIGSCCVTASDAEFGLYREGDKVEVHVFSGEVQADAHSVGRNNLPNSSATSDSSTTSDATDMLTSATVPAGNSLSLIEAAGGWKLAGAGGKAEPERFAIKLPMGGGLPISPAYVNAVVASNPVGFWRFGSSQQTTVVNEIAEGSDLKVEGKLRLTGNARNSALELQPGSNCFLVTEPLQHLGGKQFSVEAWVKPSHIQWGGVLALVSSEPAEDQAFYLELLGPSNLLNNTVAGRKYPGTVHILHRDPPNGVSSSGTSCFSQALYRHRRWQHVVATKSRDELRLYVNGELSAKTLDARKLASGLRLVVGRLGTFSFSRKLVGQIDEVALYDRALSDEEIRDHYRAVEWSLEQEAIQHHNGA